VTVRAKPAIAVAPEDLRAQNPRLRLVVPVEELER
jgi:hypothetical protein